MTQAIAPEQIQDEIISNETCSLCIGSTQHRCTKCDIPVCIPFCSIEDPNSDDELKRVHKRGDPRCIETTLNNTSFDIYFDCPKCDKNFDAMEHLQTHMRTTHDSF